MEKKMVSAPMKQFVGAKKPAAKPSKPAAKPAPKKAPRKKK